MNLKFDHEHDSAFISIGITLEVIQEVDTLLKGLPTTLKTSEIIERAQDVFKDNDPAMAFLFTKLGKFLGEVISENTQPDKPLEEPTVP